MGLGGERQRSAAIVIQPTSGWVPLNLRDLWEYFEFLCFVPCGMFRRESSVAVKQVLCQLETTHPGYIRA